MQAKELPGNMVQKYLFWSSEQSHQVEKKFAVTKINHYTQEQLLIRYQILVKSSPWQHNQSINQTVFASTPTSKWIPIWYSVIIEVILRKQIRKKRKKKKGKEKTTCRLTPKGKPIIRFSWIGRERVWDKPKKLEETYLLSFLATALLCLTTTRIDMKGKRIFRQSKRSRFILAPKAEPKPKPQS